MGANQGTHRPMENSQAEIEWVAHPSDNLGHHQGKDVSSMFTESYVHQLAYRRNSGRQEEEKVTPKSADQILKDPKKSYVEKLMELRGIVGVYRLNLLRNEANRQRNQLSVQPQQPFVDSRKTVTFHGEIGSSLVMEDERNNDTERSLKTFVDSGEVRNGIQSDSEGCNKSNSQTIYYNKSDIIENIKTTVLKDGKNEGKNRLPKPSKKLCTIKKGASGANAPKSDDSKNIITRKIECETQTTLSLSNISAKDDSSSVNFEYSKSKSIGCKKLSSYKLNISNKHDSNSKIVQDVSTDTTNRRRVKIITNKTKSTKTLDCPEDIITRKIECETQTSLSLSNISAKDDSNSVNFEYSKSKSIGCETQSSYKLNASNKHDSNSKIVQNVSTDTINKRGVNTSKTKSTKSLECPEEIPEITLQELPLDSSNLQKCTCIINERSIHNVSSCETMQSHKILNEIKNQNRNIPIKKSLLDTNERCNLQRRTRGSSKQLRKPSESKIQGIQKRKQKVQKEQDNNKTKCGSSLKNDGSRHRDISLVDCKESVLSESSCASSLVRECFEFGKVCGSTGCTNREGHRLKQSRFKSESSEKTLESPTPPSINELMQTIQESTEMNKETCKCTSSCLTKKSPPRVKVMFFPEEERKTRGSDFEDFLIKNKDDNSQICKKENNDLEKFVHSDRKLSDTSISVDYYSDLMKMSCKSKRKDSIENYSENSYKVKSIFSDCKALRGNIIRSAKRKEGLAEARTLGGCNDVTDIYQRSQKNSLTARKCCAQCPCAIKDPGREDCSRQAGKSVPPASNETSSEATLLSVGTARRRRAENLGSRSRKNMDMYLEMEKLGLGWIRHGEWIPAVKMMSSPQEKILPTCCCATKQ